MPGAASNAASHGRPSSGSAASVIRRWRLPACAWESPSTTPREPMPSRSRSPVGWRARWSGASNWRSCAEPFGWRERGCSLSWLRPMPSRRSAWRAPSASWPSSPSGSREPAFAGGSGEDVAVAALGLGGVQGLVGALDQLVPGLLEIPAGQADRTGHQGGDDPQSLHDPNGVLQRARRQQEHELLPAVAGQQVGGAHLGPPGAGRLLEHQVAGLVAEAVVVGLEVVQVDHGHADPGAHAPGPLQLPGQLLLPDPPVGHPGERVGAARPSRRLTSRLISTAWRSLSRQLTRQATLAPSTKAPWIRAHFQGERKAASWLNTPWGSSSPSTLWWTTT